MMPSTMMVLLRGEIDMPRYKVSATECRKVVADLDITVRGFTSSDYHDPIDTSGFLRLDGDVAQIDWDRVEEFAQEVAVRTLHEYLNK